MGGVFDRVDLMFNIIRDHYETVKVVLESKLVYYLSLFLSSFYL